MSTFWHKAHFCGHYLFYFQWHLLCGGSLSRCLAGYGQYGLLFYRRELSTLYGVPLHFVQVPLYEGDTQVFGAT